MGKYEKSIISIIETIKIFKQDKHDFNLSVSYANLAHSYIVLNNPDSALHYLKLMFEVNKRLDNPTCSALAFSTQALYYQIVGDTIGFLNSAYKALTITKKNNLFKEKKDITKELEEFYYSVQQFDSAYKYKQIYHQVRDSIDAANTQTKISQLEMLHEIEKAEQKQRFKAQRNQLITIIVLILLISALFITIVLLMRYSVKVKYSLLEQQKLKDELHFKSQEMVSNAISLIRKNDLISGISQRLLDILNIDKPKETSLSIGKLAKELQLNSEGNTWEEFEVRFKEVHANFFNKLIKAYPNLSPSELKLCALLKLNMSTKEISQLMGYQHKSVDNARVRLRKKLKIENQEENLVTFLLKF
jgi:DNA-binding CsgD family transcriptional regulator